MKFIYTLISYVLLPFALVRLLIKSKKNHAYKKRIAERFGKNLPAINIATEQKLIWFHAVSVGEFLACLPLINLFLDRQTNIKILITTTTPTGSAQVTEKLAAHINKQVYHCYLPYDTPIFTKRFLKHFNPSLGVFIETEIWANLLLNMRKHEISSLLINARLSEKSFNNYQKLAGFTKEILQTFNLIACQNLISKERFEILGAKSSNLGNLKFDINYPKDLKAKQDNIKELAKCRDYIIIASTHANEEEQILSKLNEITSYKNNKLLIIIAPRHPERATEIVKICEQKNIKCRMLSQVEKNNEVSGFNVLIIDKLGELIYLYSLAKIAIIGGSFVEHGGHNPLESCLYSVPTIIGESVFNFQTVVGEMLNCNALIQTDIDNLPFKINSVLDSNNLDFKDIGENGCKYLKQNQGAIERYYKLIMEELS